MGKSLINYNYVLSKDYRDVLMGLSIIWIVLHHFFGFSPSCSSVFLLFAQGSVGVDIFFFLSVYGLCYSFNSNSVGRYYINRLKRLFPIYALFVALWYGGGNFLYPIGDCKRIIINTISLSSCFAHMRTGIDIIEWYIPAQMFIYILFPVIFILMRKVCSFRTGYIIFSFFLFVGLGVFLSLFASKALFLRLPVIFIGILLYFIPGKISYIIIFISAISSLFIPHMYALSSSLIVPVCLLGYNFLFGTISDKHDFKIIKLIRFLGKHSLEIYLAQVIATAYYLKNTTHNIFVAWVISIIIIIVCSYILCKSQSLFLKMTSKIQFK